MTHLLPNKILLFLVIILLSACQPKSDQINKNFVKRYGLEVESINGRRAREKDAAQKLSEQKSKIDLKSSQQIQADFVPNLGSFKRLSNLPEDMFAIRYYSYNFPDSYGRPRLSFDDIQIPTQDAFGVTTDLGEKNYQLVDGQTLQKDVDFVRNSKEQYDDEVSLRLIREEKEKKRREYLAQKLKEKESAEIKNTKIEKEEEKNDENKTENTDKITE